MSDSRITQLSEVVSPATSDMVPIVSGAATTKVQVKNLVKAAPPQAHAASHASAGSDPVTIAESQVTNLTTDLAAKVPTTRQVIAGHGLTGTGALSADVTIALSAVVESDITLTDVTTDNVSTTAHGFAPKAPNDAKQFLNGTGAYSVPLGLTGVTPVTTTGTINDLAFSGVAVIRMNNATLATITGLAAGVDGQHVIIQSVGTGQVDLSNQDAGSQAANRLINTVSTIKTSLGAGKGWAEYEYDATTARWRLIRHEQGALIGYVVTWSSLGVSQPAIGNGTLTGNYYLHGSLLHIEIEMDAGSTTTFGQAGNNWEFSLPAAPAGSATGPCMLYDNDGAGITSGIAVYSSAAPGGAVPASSSGNATPSAPFTWATSDIIRMVLDYVIS